MKHKTRHKSSL